MFCCSILNRTRNYVPNKNESWNKQENWCKYIRKNCKIAPICSVNKHNYPNTKDGWEINADTKTPDTVRAASLVNCNFIISVKCAKKNNSCIKNTLYRPFTESFHWKQIFFTKLLIDFRQLILYHFAIFRI